MVLTAEERNDPADASGDAEFEALPERGVRS
jgi:hypothetical protein